MAFVSRAERKINAQGIHEVGPGSYNIGSSDKINQSYAPFCSSSSRALFKKDDFTPGPGSYEISKKGKPVKSFRVSSNINKTKPITENDSPGPGYYAVNDTWKPKKITVKSNNLNNWSRIPSAPSIPANHQAFGYDETTSGELVMQGNPDFVHSGNEYDSVGPGSYNFSPPKKPGICWFKSKSKRGLFYNNQTGPNLGPGAYNESTPIAPLYKFKQSAVFLSKAKEEHEENSFIGPGYYEVQKGSKKMLGKYQNFGSNCMRFATAHSDNDVGPGHYLTNDSKYIQKSRIPFTSSSPRFKYKHLLTPGPGEYSDILPKQKRLKKGTFGTSDKRFTLNHNIDTPGPGQYSSDLKSNQRPSAVFISKSCKGLNVSSENPAPGNYEIPCTFSSKKLEKSVSKSKDDKIGFVSKAERFLNSGKEDSPGPGDYQTIPKNLRKGVVLPKDVRFKDIRNIAPGPGTYIEEQADWTKKSYNVLFSDYF